MAYTNENNNVNVLHNFSTQSQVIGTTSRTYLIGSMVTVPYPGLNIGSRIRWTFDMTKTAAGITNSTFDIAFGTTGSTADTARLSFLKTYGTANVDDAFVIIECLIRGPLTSSGVAVGNFTFMHTSNITGHSLNPCICANTYSTFDITYANCNRIGLCLTTGLNDNITFQVVATEIWNL